MEAFQYRFVALRGIQAGKEYYVAMCPLKLIPKIFLFDEEEIPVELRSQRTLNRARIPEIARYLLDNKDDYVFSSLTASIDGEVSFQPLDSNPFAGMLTIPMKSRFLINDGQHRRAAIEEALRENPRLGDETISVVFFIDMGLQRSQQLFADLNTHAIRPTKSIGILYDHRDPLSRLSRRLMTEIPIFKGLTEAEKTNIAERSAKLFTLSAIYQATLALLNKHKNDEIYDEDFPIAKDYWTTLGEVIPEWRLIIQRKVSASELRQNYVHSHGVALHALGIAGYRLMDLYPQNWHNQLQKLEDLDWTRTNPMWEGRAMTRAKMSKSVENVKLTANLIMKTLDIPLTNSELDLEKLGNLAQTIKR
jgi:DNA sulfur modification protein DndB